MTDSTSMALVPRGLAEATQMSDTLSKSQLLPEHFRGKPSDVFLAIAFGLELGLGPIAALQSIYVIKGKPGLYADAMVALVLASGMAEYFTLVEMSADSATWETKRHGAPAPTRVTVSIEQAQKAGWAAQNPKYGTEPDIMLSARAKGRLAKQVYPDVLKGIASVEEIRDDAATSPGFSPPPAMTAGQVIDVTDQQAAAAPDSSDQTKNLARRIGDTKSEEALRPLAREIKAVENVEDREQLTAIYKDHGRRLRAAAAPQPDQGVPE
jgi:hypothetical protein